MSLKNRLLSIAARIVCCTIGAVAITATVYAQDIRPKEPIVVNGDKVEYFQDKKKVTGTGNISIDYKDVKLTCDQVTVYLDTREAIAEGNVKVTQKGGAYLTGGKINYNFDTQQGSVINGYVSAKPFYGKAGTVSKVGDKEIALEKGYVTTCDLDKPHYRIQSRKIKIYLDDKVVAQNTAFYIGNIPVFYIPYYVQPIREDVRKTHLTVIPGKSKDWGYYVLTAYRYYFNDKFRGDLLLDYRSKLGLAGGVNHYYNIDEIGAGSFKFYYTREGNNFAFDRDGDLERDRYRYQVRHRWDMKDVDSTAIVEFNKVSDKDIIKDYFYKEYEELQDPQDYNYFSLITTKPDYTTEFLVRKRFDKFFTVVERLPEYTIDIKNHRVSDQSNIPLYYRANASAVYLNKTFEKVVPEAKDYGVVRLDTYNQLSYAARFFRALNVTPYIGTEQTYFSKNAFGDTNLVRGALVTGVDNSIKFYKIYDVNSNVLGMDINKLRHIITPTANFYHTGHPTIAPENLMQFDTIDALSARNGVTLALENKLQTKRGSIDNMQSVDLATFIVSTDYSFRLKRNNIAYESQRFEYVDLRLELIPYPWLYTLSKMRVNTKTYAVQTTDIDLVGTGGDDWSLGAGYRYEKATSGTSNLLTLGAMYKINDIWRVRAYERFNAIKGSLEEQEYTIYRDLHCWIAEVTYDIKNMEDQSVWIVMRLKAFPDVPLGFKRTYYRPRFGASGN